MSPPDVWNTVPTLRGQQVALQPLQLEHVPGLRAALEGSGLDQLWYTQVPSPQQVEHYVQAALQAHAEGKVLPFVIRDAAGDIIGSTRFYDMDASVPDLNAVMMVRVGGEA